MDIKIGMLRYLHPAALQHNSQSLQRFQQIAIAKVIWTFSLWSVPSLMLGDSNLSSLVSVTCRHRPEILARTSFQRERFSHSVLFSLFGPLSGRQLEWMVELELLLSLLLQRYPATDKGVQWTFLWGSWMPGTLGGNQGLLPTSMPRSVNYNSVLGHPSLQFQVGFRIITSYFLWRRKVFTSNTVMRRLWVITMDHVSQNP